MQGLEKLPPALREPVRAQWDDWRAAAAAAGVTLPEAPELAESLPRVWAASDWLVRQCLARPALLAEIWATDPVRPDPPGAMRERVTAAVAGASDDKAFMAALRRARNLEQARIAWRDLAGWASLDETLGDLSAFADLAIETALEHARASLEPRFGVPRDAEGERVDLVVLGMGKLGGQELNFSSDIDLIFSYRAGGQTDGERTLSNEEYFTRLGQRLIRLLDEPTAEGFVFRVDMRLRPFGEAGPLVLNFGAMETYYQTHGREWERYAFIKARPCAGDRAAGEELLAGLRPFIYRRYLDFAVFESLREMKDMISAEVVRRGLEDNVKLGRGGIREIEFIGQLFQLIRAGREPALRERRIMLVLPALAEAGYLAAAEVERLLAAYRFLRRLENRLQAWGDRQTHDLPHAPALRERLALAMEFDGWPALAEALEAHRRFVQQMFDQVFVGPRLGVGEHRPDSRLDAVWERTLDEAEARRVLTEEGYEDGGEALALLDSLQDSAVIRAMGERGRKRLNQLVPAVLAAAAREEAAALTLGRVLRVVEAIAKRTAYLALLVENPDALKHLTRLCSASPWITDLVARHPLLLDELIDPRIFSDTPRPEDYGPALDAALADRDADDLEGQMDALREFQQASVMRVAVADIAGQLPVMKVSDHLTWIAEHIVRRVLDLAWAHLARRHGAPACTVDGTRRPASFAVVAYGKLGGLELGYGSDLDLVFLHDSKGEAQHTEGERSIDNAVFFSRLTQRIIHLLSTPTAAGVLYEVDTRLRPSGSAGLLVSSLNAFRDYQRDKAWTWEHQALLRARSVAGTPALCENFEALRREVLATPGDAAALRRAVRAMRERMRRELPRAAEEGFDLKSDPGGLTDVEFLVQYWSLLHAPATPELIRYTDNMRLLESLADHGLIGAAERDSLSAAYLAYRTRIHELTLKGRALVDSDGSLAHLAREVAALWSRTMEGED